MAEYLFATNGHTPTDWQLKGVAVAGYTVAGLRRSTLNLCKVILLMPCSLDLPYKIRLLLVQWPWNTESAYLNFVS